MLRPRIRVLLVLAGLWLAAIACGPVAAEGGGIREGEFANGLTYFIDPAPRPDGKILFKLILPVGDKEMLPREQSVAHVVEHIVFASEHLADTKGTLRARIERFGGLWGNDANAAGVIERSSYYVRLPAAQSHALQAGLDILYDWAAPRVLSDEEIDREIRAVIEERRRGLTEAAMDRAAAQHHIWFAGHPHYDYRPDRTGMLSATPAGVRAFYRSYYVPSHMAVIIAGAPESESVLAALAKRIGTLPRGEDSPPLATAGVLPVEGGHYALLAADGPAETRLELTFKYRPARGGDGLAREKAIGLIVDRAAASILPSLSERYGAPSRGIGLQSESMVSYPGIAMLNLVSTLRAGAAREGLAELLRLEATLRRDGFPEHSIETARREVVGALIDARSDEASRFEDRFLRGVDMPLPGELRAAAEQVTAAEINAQLARWLDPSNRDVFLFYPGTAGATVPDADEFAALDNAAGRAPSLRLAVPEVRNPAFIPFLPPPVASTRAAPEAGGYVRWTLPRSRATLLYHRTAGSEVRIAMLREGGLGAMDSAEAPVAALAADVVARSGLAGLDDYELGRFLMSKSMSLSAVFTIDREGLKASAPVAEWPTLFALVRSRILHPLCRTEAFDELKRQRLDPDGTDAELGEPAEFQARIASLSGFRSAALAPDTLRALSAADICPRYAAPGLGGIDGMVIAVEADLDPQIVYAEIASTLDLPAQGLERRRAKSAASSMVVHGRPTQAGRDVVRIGTRKSARIQLVMRWAPGQDERAGTLVAAILDQRMAARLRTVEKGTYDTDVAFSPDDASLTLAFETAPEQVERMIMAAKEEFARLKRDGVAADEIAAARLLVQDESLTPSVAAEAWIRRRTLHAVPPVDDADVRDWIRRRIAVARLHEFVALPRE